MLFLHSSPDGAIFGAEAMKRRPHVGSYPITFPVQSNLESVAHFVIACFERSSNATRADSLADALYSGKQAARLEVGPMRTVH
jgi:hypothetical protein